MKTLSSFKFTPLALLVAALTACSPAPETAAPAQPEPPAGTIANQSESERLNAFFERTFEEDLKRSPEFQSRLGKKWNYGEWNDLSEEHKEQDFL